MVENICEIVFAALSRDLEDIGIDLEGHRCAA